VFLAEWLDTWLPEYTGNTKAHAKKFYEASIENHIKPVLGSKALQGEILAAEHIGMYWEHCVS